MRRQQRPVSRARTMSLRRARDPDVQELSATSILKQANSQEGDEEDEDENEQKNPKEKESEGKSGEDEEEAARELGKKKVSRT